MMELMNTLGLHASCLAMLLVMVFLSFGQKLIASPSAEDKETNDVAEFPKLHVTEAAMSNK